MKRSLLWLITACLGSLSFAACTQQPGTFILSGDDDGDGEGAGTGTGGSGSGTTGSGSPTSGGGSNAQAMFESQVFPAIATDCGSCHATGDMGAPVFLASSPSASYTAITGYSPTLIAVPENSNLILHGVHTGPALTPTQEGVVSAWLQAEADERGLAGGGGDDPTPTGKTLDQALDEFANCMDLTEWEENMANLPRADTANAGECSGCHTSGDGGAFLSLNTQETFDMNKQFPYIKRLVTGTVNSNGAFADLLPSNRFINKGLEAQSCDPQTQNCHPVYNLPPGIKTGIETVVNNTLERWHNNQCP
ncbi:MAG: hypothetical protein JNL21_19250 [Myxococcales bacterium]|nr:hypothetical protein [Myxococcales bacterium]